MKDSSRFSLLRNSLLLMGALVLTACGGGGGARSPDLPLPESKLLGFTTSCSPAGPLAAGSSSQCVVTQCIYRNTDSSGNVSSAPGACPTVTWSAGPAAAAEISSTGLLTTSTSITTTTTVVVTATSGGVSDDFSIVVNPACATSITVSSPTQSIVAGLTTQPYRAIATFDNGLTGDVSSSTQFSIDPPTAGNFTANNAVATNPEITTSTTATITGTYTSSCSGPLTDDTSLTITPASVIAGGLCLEPVDGTQFTSCRVRTGGSPGCAATPARIDLTSGQTRQLRLRAIFDNNLECNVTDQPGASITSQDSGVATASNTAPGRGLVTGVAVGNTNIEGEYTLRGITNEAVPVPVQVNLTEALGPNSLGIGAKSYSVTDTPAKFACVGSTDLVGGLSGDSIQGQLSLFAGVRFCEPGQIGDDNNCDFEDDNTVRDATNASTIIWKPATEGYWNGQACQTTLPELPIGDGAPLIVGNTQTPADLYSQGIRRIGDKGVVTAAGNLRLGFACVTAEYTNPADPTNKDSDGMTVLVLPVTNDVLLGPSSAADATRLCDTLAPLLLLGAPENGGNGALIQILSVVTEVVNPILQELAAGDEEGNTGPLPVDAILGGVIEGLALITEPLFDAALTPVLEAINDGVVDPLLCGVGTLLTALTTGDPAAIADAQACLPAPPTTP